MLITYMMKKKGGEKIMKKVSLILAMLCLGLALVTSQAFAFTLDYGGRVKFIFSSFDTGALYLSALPGTVIASSPAAADAAAIANATNSDSTTSYPAGSAPGGVPYLTGSAREDSWGIFDVSSIVRADNGATLWTRGIAGEYLTGYFHHEVDHYVKHVFDDPVTSAPVWEIRGIEGYIDVFLDTVDDFATGNTGPSARNGFGYYGDSDAYGYPGSAADDGSEGSSFLRLKMSPGVIAGDASSTFYSLFAPGASFSSSGRAYMDIIGGDYAGMFDYNTETDPNGTYHDFFLEYTASPNQTWTVTNTGAAFASTPEPTSMFLFGMGMLGLVATRIRKKKAA